MGICTKIGIVGMGHVGAHVANSLVLQGIADELYMTEICSGERDRSKKLAAEVQALGDSLAFCPHNVALHNCGDDYAQLAQCDVIVNCAGDVSLSSKDPRRRALLHHRHGEDVHQDDRGRRIPRHLDHDREPLRRGGH